MDKIRMWLRLKMFWLKTGQKIVIANGGKAVDEVVIQYGDFYFGIMLDAESGEPTGDFGWSRDPMMFHVPLREQYIATKREYDGQ